MSVPTQYLNSKGLSVRTFAARLIVLACAGAALMPAVAAAETKENTTQFEVKAGSLTFSTAPTMPTLTAVTLKGEAQKTNTTMNNFAVQDATGSGSGWNVTIEGQAGGGKSAVFKQYCPEAKCGAESKGYIAGGFELAANSLTLTSTGASFTAEHESTGTAPTFVCGAGCSVDHATGVKIAHAEAAAGMGTWATTGFGASSLSLATPSTLKVLPEKEVYHVDLLWTLSTGP
jgi:putative surface cell wall-binding protein